MFGPDFYIDSFQTTKKIVTDSVILDKTLNKAAHDFIEAQTSFAKMLSHNFIDITKYSFEKLTGVWFPSHEKSKS
jgi:hypothetical protein